MTDPHATMQAQVDAQVGGLLGMSPLDQAVHWKQRFEIERERSHQLITELKDLRDRANALLKTIGAYAAGRESMRAESPDTRMARRIGELGGMLDAERARSEELYTAMVALWNAIKLLPPEWIMNAPDEFHDLIEIAHKATANERKRQGANERTN